MALVRGNLSEWKEDEAGNWYDPETSQVVPYDYKYGSPSASATTQTSTGFQLPSWVDSLIKSYVTPGTTTTPVKTPINPSTGLPYGVTVQPKSIWPAVIGVGALVGLAWYVFFRKPVSRKRRRR